MFKTLKAKASDFLEQSKQGLIAEDQSGYFGDLWESNEHTWKCRACATPFQPPITTKHHCRGCGLIYCNACAPSTPTNTNAITKAAAEFVASHNVRGQHDSAPLGAIVVDAEVRVCAACFDGQSPGSVLRYKVKGLLGKMQSSHKPLAPKSAHSKRMKKDGDEEGLLDAIGLGEHHEHSRIISLSREAKADADFGENEPAPRAGHFEFTNKTGMMVELKASALKEKIGTVEMESHEILCDLARPPFISVAPNQVVSGGFEPTEDGQGHLIVHVLYGNPFPPMPEGTIISEGPIEARSSCANVTLFESAACFKIHALKKNAIIKCKPEGGDKVLNVVPRKGTSPIRVGLANWLSSKKTIANKNSIDMDTNCNNVYRTADVP